MNAVAIAVEPEPARKTDWRLVAIFYGLAFGWVSLVALGLYLSGASMSFTQAPVYAQLIVGFLYMPAPLVAALITERIAHRRLLIRDTFRYLKPLRWLAVGALVPPALFVTELALTFVFGNLLHVPGAGHLVAAQGEFIANVIRLLGPRAVNITSSNTPPLWAFYLGGAVVAVFVGFTVNGLFGFGEEYGWRGFLMDELRPLGGVKANLLTGVLWGLWHAPLIVMGFNFAPYDLIGPLFMVLLCIPFSFLLWAARDYSGSVLAAAVLHGAFNGMAGILALLAVGRGPLVGIPTGALGALGLAIVAIPVWRLAKRSPAVAPSAEE